MADRLLEVRKLIDRADSAYYRDGMKEVMPNAEYDALKRELKTLDPNDERHARVGVPAYTAAELRTKVTHPFPMGSLDNTDGGIAGFQPWYDKTCSQVPAGSDLSIFGSLKIDGGSIRASYVNGKLVQVASRGNGAIGEDLTINGINFKGIPTTLPVPISCDVRGEAVLPVADFKAIQERQYGVPFDQIPEADRSNPRNIGNGIFGRDSGEDSEKLQFLAFNIVSDTKYGTEVDKMEHLKALGFQHVPYRVCQTPAEFETFYNEILTGRNKLPFEIDGIVVVMNSVAVQDAFITDLKSRLRPKHSRAVKFPEKANTTVLEGVTLTVGHTGSIAPTGILKTVRIGGVNVTNVLLNNWEEIERLGVQIGDEVEVVLAGDIIPKVIRVVKQGAKRTPIVEPPHCPSCGEATTRTLRGKRGAVTYCCNKKCPAQAVAKIDAWIGSSKKGVGIMEIGDTMLRALWDNELISDPADLYTLTVDQIKDVTMDGGGRIGKSRAEKIIANINSKRQIPLHVFLGSLGIELLGRRRVQILAEAANGQLSKLSDWLDVAKLSTIELPGFGDSIRDAIVAGIEDNRDLIAKLLANGVTVEDETLPQVAPVGGVPSSNLPFAGFSFCFTGTRDCIDDVIRLGGTTKSGVSKGLDFLVQKDATSASNKTRKAEEYGTSIISIDYLKRAIAGEVTLTRPQPVEA